MKETRPVDRVITAVVVVLAVVGILSALARVFFLEDLATLVELRLQESGSPLASGDLDQVREFDARFASHRATTLLHVLLGSVLLCLAPLQFSRKIRGRRPRFHRWSGRLLVLTTLVVVPTGLVFGLMMPLGGAGEVAASGLFGGLCVVAVARAFFAIRAGRVALHREWMIRAFAIVFGISTIRLIAPAIAVTLGGAGLDTPTIFAVSLWCGWLLTLGAAEFWIRRTRDVAWSHP